jgi:Na+/H+ antiporter NhaD/arsenite permease-like protein
LTPETTFALTAGIFAVTYLGMALGKVPWLRVDRAGIAFVGAVAMLVAGVITLAEATAGESIDYGTILLLLGMMVVVGVLRLSGFFAQVAEWSLRRIKTPRGLLLVTIFLSGILSAFLVNDIVCLALTPVVLHLARRLKFDPLPHVIGLATGANIGSVGTITGNPQNMIIGMQSGISYVRFAAHLFPLALMGLVIDFLVVAWVFRAKLIGQKSGGGPNDHDPGESDVPQSQVHRWLRIKSLTVTLIALALFFTGLPIAIVAAGAAAVLMLGRIKPERIYLQIDWSLLLMFASLFIVVHAFDRNVVSHWDIGHWELIARHPVTILSLVAAGLSNLVSNVPAILLLEPVARALPVALRDNAWLTLAMSSTFAGNLTILGSVANLIVVENAKRDGVTVSFWDYCKVGVPVTLLTLGMGVVWLKFVHY